MTTLVKRDSDTGQLNETTTERDVALEYVADNAPYGTRWLFTWLVT